MDRFLISKKALSCLLMISLCNMLWFSSYAWAEMIGTETVIGPSAENPVGREKVRAFFNRQEILPKLEAYGVSREEALARVDSLTDEEVATLVRKIDQMPEGGYYDGEDFFIGILILLGVIIVIGLIVFIGIIAIFKTSKNKKAQVEDINKKKYANENKTDQLASESN